MEVVRVAENDLRADRVELVRVDGLDGRLRPDRHEDRRADVAVRGVENAGARGAVARGDLEDAHARAREPGGDAGRDFLVARRVGRRVEVVLADPAELGDDGAQRRGAAEERRDADGVRRELVELRVQLALAAVAPEVPPLVCAARPQGASQPAPSGTSANDRRPARPAGPLKRCVDVRPRTENVMTRRTGHTDGRRRRGRSDGARRSVYGSLRRLYAPFGRPDRAAVDPEDRQVGPVRVLEIDESSSGAASRPPARERVIDAVRADDDEADEAERQPRRATDGSRDRQRRTDRVAADDPGRDEQRDDPPSSGAGRSTRDGT